ncbi:hypothetical protein TH5_20650 [Thalassospira xianhensis MCCC 1A02616]|uniref:Uncharacterized protein n=1 Tax=Thalassospira xianhensis MCCC 1A02616 TaxID=1177929 RepID=A0A367UB77_9PROT|nr:hypothetical protein TH5_20650 [Thalassospira xianhensis MCCC 1A02616]
MMVADHYRGFQNPVQDRCIADFRLSFYRTRTSSFAYGNAMSLRRPEQIIIRMIFPHTGFSFGRLPIDGGIRKIGFIISP